MTEQILETIHAGLGEGTIIPYLGPGVRVLTGERPTALHNYLATLPVLPMSESDFIRLPAGADGPTQIPPPVQSLCAGRQFLFLGCRFMNERDRIFACRLTEGSSALHWAVLPEMPTPDEERFLAKQNIQRIELPLPNFVATLTEARRAEKLQLLQASW